MAKELCTFHHNHGLNIRLLENKTVAHRVDSYNNGVVFTEQPIPNGYMFQIEVINKNYKDCPGSLRIGITNESPEKAEIPLDATSFCSKSDYWVLTNNQAYNSDFGMFLNFNINSLSMGQAVGLSVSTNGKLCLYVDGTFSDVVWRGLPTDKQYWGMADVFGPVSSIRSSFILLPSLRTPNKPKMLSSTTYSDVPIPLKEQTSPSSTTITIDNKFEIGDFVIVPQRNKTTVSGIVRWIGEVKLSTKALAITAVGIETNEEVEDKSEYFDLYFEAIKSQKQAFFKIDSGHSRTFRPAHQVFHAVSFAEHQIINEKVKKDSAACNEASIGKMEAKDPQIAIKDTSILIRTLREQLVLQEKEFSNKITKLEKENQILNEEKQQLEVESKQLKEQLDLISWKVSHKEITLTVEELGRGGWGAIKIGIFQEQRVAVKQMYQVIVSSDNLELIYREINTMATLRHPNILQFIGAVLDDPSGNPMIITEVMDTTLRNAYINRELTPDPSCQPTLLTIMRDVAAGLNYLHCLHDPIIHRDISSSNVLLEYKGHHKWKTKISDFGSANKAHKAVTIATGAFVYSAPESSKDVHKEQTTKLDSYSYGILLCEVMSCRFPDSSVFQEMLRQMFAMSRNIYELILSCIKKDPEARPSMKRIIERLDICRKLI